MANRYTFYTIIWALLTGSLVSVPGRLIPRITGTANLILDTSSHFFFFFVLGFLLYRSFRYGWLSGRRNLAFMLTAFIGFIYGLALEIIQIPIPERAFEWSDALANGIGVIFGAYLSVFFKKG